MKTTIEKEIFDIIGDNHQMTSAETPMRVDAFEKSDEEKMKVISFTSSSTFRNTDKKIPEIAEELGVSYVLEGSVRLVKDRIKIITQLINANDEHIWSKEYEENAEDIIKVQNDVAEEVIKQLKITLSILVMVRKIA